MRGEDAKGRRGEGRQGDKGKEIRGLGAQKATIANKLSIVAMKVLLYI